MNTLSDFLKEKQKEQVADQTAAPSTLPTEIAVPTIEAPKRDEERKNPLLSILTREFWTKQPSVGELAGAAKQVASDTGSSFMAGVGDVAVGAGSAARWLGADDFADTLTEFGSGLQERYEIPYDPEITWETLIDPTFWTSEFPKYASTHGVRAMPFSLALIPAALVGAKAGAATGAAVGLGTLGRSILASVGASAFSRPLEAAIEAGGVYDEALRRGMSEEEARTAADQVFRNNLALSGLDAAQFATAFAPIPPALKQTLGRSQIARLGAAGARLGFGALTEAGEELLQEGFANRALGDPFLGESSAEAALLGGFMGLGFGGTGEISQAFRRRTLDELGPEVTQVFEEESSRIQSEQGMTKDQADTMLLEQIAQTEEGRLAILRAAQDLVQQLQQGVSQLQQDPKAPVHQGPPPPGLGYTLEPSTRATRPEQSQTQQSQQPAPTSQEEIEVEPVMDQQAGASVQVAPTPVPPSAVVPDQGSLTPTPQTMRPVRPEMARQEGPSPTQERPDVPSIEEGQTVYLIRDGEVQPNPYVVVDASDPSLVRLRSPQGAEFQTGRRALTTEPPPVQPTQKAEEADGSITSPAPESLGNTVQVQTERGTPVDVQYAIVEADNLITSHDTDLRQNPAFPEELQPRDRTRVASELQINRMANRLRPEFLGESPKASEGAPIVGPDMVVESGNARSIAIKRAYDQGSADHYLAFILENAERFGIDPGALAGMDRPALVRIRRSEIDRRQFVVEANETSVASMSATEQAMVDADRISGDLMGLFQPSEDGEVITPANREFVSSFMERVVGPNDRARYMTAEGRISQEGINRIRNAVFARAYGDADAIAQLAESPDSNVRNITGGMLIAAPQMASLRERVQRGQLYPLDPTSDISVAMRKMSHLRSSGQDVETYLQQEGMFEDDLSPLAKDFLETFDKYKRSRTRIANILRTFVDMVESLGNPQQASMFEEIEVPGPQDVLQAAIEKVSEGYESTAAPQATLFEGGPPEGGVAQEEAGTEGVQPAELSLQPGTQSEGDADPRVTTPTRAGAVSVPPAPRIGADAIQEEALSELLDAPRVGADAIQPDPTPLPEAPRIGVDAIRPEPSAQEVVPEEITVLQDQARASDDVEELRGIQAVLEQLPYESDVAAQVIDEIEEKVRALEGLPTEEERVDRLREQGLLKYHTIVNALDQGRTLYVRTSNRAYPINRSDLLRMQPDGGMQMRSGSRWLNLVGYQVDDLARQAGLNVDAFGDVEEVGADIKPSTPASQIANFVQSRLEAGTSFTSQDLFNESNQAFGGTQAEGTYTPKDAYDAMELGVNRFLAQNADGIADPTVSLEEAIINLEAIQAQIMENIPTQTRRTEESDEFQQFSTPPNLAYVAAWISNVSPQDVVLEPSAGIGGLAVFAQNAGATTVVNELSERRAEILREMGFDEVYTENAEQLHNILPPSVRPTLVIMNPPFSSTAGRKRGERKTINATRHIDQALSRLEPGGRLVAIVGRGMSMEAPAFRKWWKDIQTRYNVRANIGIDGKNYTRYGTQFDVRLLVIDKDGATRGPVLTGNYDELSEVLRRLEDVRNDRVLPERAEVQQAPGEPRGRAILPEDQAQGADPGRRTLPPATDVVGPGGRTRGTRRGQGSVRDDSVQGPRGEIAPSESGSSDASALGEGRSGAGRTVGDSGRVEGEVQPPGSGAVSRGEVASSDPRERGTDGPRLTTPQEDVHSQEELGDSIYVQYRPKKVQIEGAHPHPGALAESAAMGAVDPPAATYTPNLPSELIEKGLLSDAQLEAIVYAGQAHEQILPDGNRRGFFIGDGTGVGKGREIAGIIIDNMRQGRDKAVWVSKNMPLLKDAVRDYTALGGQKEDLFSYHTVKSGSPIQRERGILFTSYSTLANGSTVSANGTLQPSKKDVTSRLDALVNWLGKDFDGVIVFDEAHMMRNSLATKTEMGRKDPAAIALAGVELQNRLPNARIVYVSATGASDVINLAYAERLGLWGEGTPFADKQDFINKIGASGLAAMELVARDLKAQGAYLARSLSYDGVSYSTTEHALTPDQVQMYDTMAQAWQIVLQNVEAALDETQMGNNGRARGRALSQFWGAHQRFFQQVLTSLQMPTVIEEIRKDIADGKAVVLQLVNTNEAAQNRALASRNDDDPLEELDLTPRTTLAQYIEKAFPVHQYEEVQDDNGNSRWVLVTDSAGNPVFSQEALARREELLDRLGEIRIPEGPLETLLNTFGTDSVAEVTGRTQRVVKDPTTGEATVERRSERHGAADADAFMNDQKQILVFSNAGGTGRSYHADLNAKNQRPRVHYLLQPGWVAEDAVQGFGRTHRTNQAQPPHYKLVTTNLMGQRRFVSSIARRLDQLGALTRGQRQTGGQGMFSERDNLEGPFARLALDRFYNRLIDGDIDLGMEAKELLEKMGLGGMLTEEGVLRESDDTRNITRFLNRILSLEFDLQNRTFNAFMDIYEQVLEQAAIDGTLDVGMENYKADTIEVVQEEVVHSDEGVETRYVELKAGERIQPLEWEPALEMVQSRSGHFVRNERSGRVYGLVPAGTRTLETGAVVDRYRRIRPDGVRDYVDSPQVAHLSRLDEPRARELWEREVASLPEFRYRPVHVITGALLPIWDRLPGGKARVLRLRTDDGRVMLGRVIPSDKLNETLSRLGAGQSTQREFDVPDTLDKILEDGHIARLANGWRIRARRVSGEMRLEIEGAGLHTFSDQLRRQGVFTERIDYKTRFFIPTGRNAEAVFQAVTANRPIVDLAAPRRTQGVEDVVTEFGSAVNRELDKINGEGTLGFLPSVFRDTRRQSTERRSPHAFADPDTEKQFNDSQGIQEAPTADRVSAWLQEHINKATRDFEHLPRTEEFAPLRSALQILSRQRSVATEDALTFIRGILHEMDSDAYDLFRRKVILDDLAEDAEMRQLDGEDAVPFGFTVDSLLGEKERIDQKVDGDESVQEALDKRRRMWRAVIQDYVRSMRAIGFNVENRFTRESYYRHQVLQYAMAEQRLRGTGQRLRTPTGRGFLRRREGSSLNINTDYIQAEFEVLAQMLYDIQVAKAIRVIQEQYNIAPRLKDQAKQINSMRLQEVIAEERERMFPGMADAPNALGTMTPTEESLQDFARKIAIGFDRLRRLAASEVGLPNGKGSEDFSDVIEAWQKDAGETVGEEELTDEQNAEPLTTNRVFQYLAWLRENGSQEAQIAAGSVLKAVSDRREFIKGALGNRYVTWESLIPEGYEVWQPREGDVFFMADSVSARVADQLQRGLIEQLGITSDDLRKVFAKGGRHREYVVKSEVAATLDSLGKMPDSGAIARLSRTANRGFKWMVLMMPHRLPKFITRNLSGDLEAVLIGNPSTLRKAFQSVKELRESIFGDRPITGEMREWFKRGGLQSLQSVQELPDLNRLRIFEQFRELRGEQVGPLRVLLSRYLQGTSNVREFFESALRYAAYLDYLEQMQADPDGRPKNFGASIREQIMALDDIRDRAWHLSNQLVGAYDEVTVLGQEISEKLIPFWRFQEVNMRRYYRFWRNAAEDGEIASAVGRRLLVGAAVRSPVIAYRVGKLALKLSAFSAMLAVWNNLFFPDEEESLPDHVRESPHIILGRDKDGNVLYFSRLGILGDALEWFGADDPFKYVFDYLNGRMTIKEIALEMAMTPIEAPAAATKKVLQSLSPWGRTLWELAVGRKYFPEPSPIRDPYEHIADAVGLGDFYSLLAGKPGRGFDDLRDNIILYKSDPLETAYWKTRDRVYEYQASIGKGGGGAFVPGGRDDRAKRSNALYYFKQALRYGDQDAARRYLLEYSVHGGSKSGLEKSLEDLHPLGPLAKEDVRGFLASLDPFEMEQYMQAVEYYNTVVSNLSLVLYQSRPAQTPPKPQSAQTPGSVADLLRQRQQSR